MRETGRAPAWESASCSEIKRPRTAQHGRMNAPREGRAWQSTSPRTDHHTERRPRSGKSSIAAAIQQTFDGVWMNLGVDRFMQMTPARYLPGIGLRPGGERPISTAHPDLVSRDVSVHPYPQPLGAEVVVDVGHHDAYAVPRGILPDCVRRLGLAGLVRRCALPTEIIMERRHATWGADDAVDAPVRRPCACGKRPSTPGHL